MILILLKLPTTIFEGLSINVWLGHQCTALMSPIELSIGNCLVCNLNPVIEMIISLRFQVFIANEEICHMREVFHAENVLC